MLLKESVHVPESLSKFEKSVNQNQKPLKVFLELKYSTYERHSELQYNDSTVE
jgi:hypothetical protein